MGLGCCGQKGLSPQDTQAAPHPLTVFLRGLCLSVCSTPCPVLSSGPRGCGDGAPLRVSGSLYGPREPFLGKPAPSPKLGRIRGGCESHRGVVQSLCVPAHLLSVWERLTNQLNTENNSPEVPEPAPLLTLLLREEYLDYGVQGTGSSGCNLDVLRQQKEVYMLAVVRSHILLKVSLNGECLSSLRRWERRRKAESVLPTLLKQVL